MSRKLSQLRCGHCQERFWPALEASALPAVICPACGAPHVNPGSRSFTYESVYRNSRFSSQVKELARWMDAWWVDDPPKHGIGLWWTNMSGMHATIVDGFPCCAVIGTVTICMVVCWLPAAARGGSTSAKVSKLGLWSASGLNPSDAISRLLAEAKSLGAEPVYRLDEVADPTPLETDEATVAADPSADARLESQAQRCGGCGAPVGVSELIGDGLCPWCGVSWSLPPALREELRLYQRRIHAGHLQRPNPALAAWSAVEGVALACVHCGAPNTHQPGALDETCSSCRSPLIPSAPLMARGVEQRNRAALSAQVAGTRRIAQTYRSSHAAGQASLMVFVVPTLLSSLFYLGLAIYGLVSGGDLKCFFPICATGPFAFGALAIGWGWRTRGRRIAQRWRPRLDRLAAQLNALPLANTAQMHAWIRRWWRGVVPPDRLQSGPGWGAMTFQIGGFPIVLSARVEVMAPLVNTGVSWRPDAGLLLAGTPARDAEYWIRQAEAAHLNDLLGEHGYSVEITTSGLRLSARPELLRQMASEPDRLLQLAPVAFLLARLAHHTHLGPPRSADERPPPAGPTPPNRSAPAHPAR